MENPPFDDLLLSLIESGIIDEGIPIELLGIENSSVSEVPAEAIHPSVLLEHEENIEIAKAIVSDIIECAIKFIEAEGTIPSIAPASYFDMSSICNKRLNKDLCESLENMSKFELYFNCVHL